MSNSFIGFLLKIRLYGYQFLCNLIEILKNRHTGTLVIKMHLKKLLSRKFWIFHHGFGFLCFLLMAKCCDIYEVLFWANKFENQQSGFAHFDWQKSLSSRMIILINFWILLWLGAGCRKLMLIGPLFKRIFTLWLVRFPNGVM